MDNAFIKRVAKAVLSSKNMYGGGGIGLSLCFSPCLIRKHTHTHTHGIHDLSIFGGYEYRAASSVR